MAKKIGIRYVITGENVRTESHLPKAWSQGHMDWRYIYSIHRQFGKIPLKTFPHMSFLAYNWYRVTLNKFTILNYINFVKQEARATLEQELGWRDYGGKHYESIYTRFYQGYILPKKFGYDKRRSHLSSLICSGEISRKDALEELKKEPYPLDLQQEDMSYVIKKLEISEDEFNRIMALPCRSYMDYPSYSLLERNRLYQYLRFVYRIVRKS